MLKLLHKAVLRNYNTESMINCMKQHNRMFNCQISWVLVVAEELYGDFEDLETGVVYKGKHAAEGNEV